MSYNAVVYNVMIASPGDVYAERGIIREVISEWNAINAEVRGTVVMPIGWETHSSPEMGDRPQEIVNKQILERCDLLVGVIWTKIGTPTGKYVSGTVEEIEEHIGLGKPTMLYFSEAPVVPGSIDQDQYKTVVEFRESCKKRGLYFPYSDLNDFRSKFNRQFQIKLNEDLFRHSGGQTSEQVLFDSSVPDVPSLSKEAEELLKEASQDPRASITRLAFLGGFMIQTNGRGFVEANNPRSKATWEAAITELETNDLITAQGYQREIFELTKKGFEVAEMLRA